MKKSIVLLIALLSLVGCSNVKESVYAKGGHKTTYCSCYEPNPTPVLDSFGLNATYKIEASVGNLRSHQQLLERTNENYILFDNYQSVTTFADDLEAKSEYGSYNETVEFLNSVQEKQFDDKKLIITDQFELGSGGYSLYFNGAYLKEDILYLHGFRFDQTSSGAEGKAFTMDIVFTCGYMWIDKDISFTDFKAITDIDQRKPMVVELE